MNRYKNIGENPLTKPAPGDIIIITKEDQMNKGRLLLIIACFALVHTQVAATPDIRTLPLNPHTKVSPTETNQWKNFLREFNLLAFALGIYYLDAKERLSKEDIKEKLTLDSAIWEKEFGITFDLDNIDFKKKGFTRCYPFTVNGKDFIIRIFDARDRHYLRGFEILYEDMFEKPRIGFQILPGINTILNGKKVERVSFSDPAAYFTHP